MSNAERRATSLSSTGKILLVLAAALTPIGDNYTTYLCLTLPHVDGYQLYEANPFGAFHQAWWGLEWALISNTILRIGFAIFFGANLWLPDGLMFGLPRQKASLYALLFLVLGHTLVVLNNAWIYLQFSGAM